MWMFSLYLLWGVVVGLAVGMTAIGTGLLGTPGLMLLFGMPELHAVGTMSFCGIFMMSAGAVGHLKHGQVTWKVALAFGLTAIPTAFIAASCAGRIEAVINFKVIMGVVIVAAVAMMFLRLNAPHGESVRNPFTPERWQVAAAPLIGVFSGFLVGATSISGSIIVLSLLFAVRLPEKIAVGTTVFISAVALLAGTLGHGLEGRIEWLAVAGLLPGVVAGAFVGSHLVKRLPVKSLRLVMMAVLAAAGIWILVKGLLPDEGA